MAAHAGLAEQPYPVTPFSCPPGHPYFEGSFCIVAVVRFKGDLAKKAINITSYMTNGSAFGTVTATNGVAILRFPNMTHGATFFAAANLREMTPGSYQGENYSFVDHWSTVSAQVQR